ncbi:sugar phosphorylase, partial [Fictibacillus sp. NRS-1165]
MEHIKDRLAYLYPKNEVEEIWPNLENRLVEAKEKRLKDRKPTWDEKDVVLITYADQFHEKEQPTLATFKQMFNRYLADKFEVVHLLPFYPYSSDDGFSVIDYKNVNPIAGDWEDV